MTRQQSTHIPVEEHHMVVKEFDDFTYTVSHDFNAPLRHIKEFSRLLELDLAAKLTPETAEYLRIINKSSSHMQQMLEGLLVLSRIKTTAVPFAAVDCNDIVAGVLKSQAKRIEDRSAVIDVADLPTVYGDENQIHQLFFQLIDNAIKFRRDDAPPHITIRAVEVDEGWQFTIADNGMGLEPELVPMMLQLFKTRHPREGTAGVGVGLNICKKIIERHHGTLAILPNEPHGTQLQFLLPNIENRTTKD